MGKAELFCQSGRATTHHDCYVYWVHALNLTRSCHSCQHARVYYLYLNDPMSTFSERLIEARLEKKLSQDRLAKAVGLKNASSIGNMEREGRIGSKSSASLAAALGVNALWLETGEGDKYPPKKSKDDWWPVDKNDPEAVQASAAQFEKNTKLFLLKHQTQDQANVRMALIQPSVPVISFIAAGQMKDIGYVPDLHDLEDAETVTPRIKVGPRSWALEIDGYSMHDGSPSGWGPGYRIICDPDKGHKSGSYVIAKNVNDQSATFKQLIFEDDCWFLRPLNKDPIYKTIKIDDPCIRVIAVVTEVIPPSILL